MKAELCGRCGWKGGVDGFEMVCVDDDTFEHETRCPNCGKEISEYQIDPSTIKVLIACEESGTVRDAFTKLGFDATSCDLQISRTHGKHYFGSVFDIINEGWDLMIGHPPCTKMANSGARWMYKGGVLQPTRYKEALDAKEFFLKLYNAPIPFIALENPTPLRIVELPTPSQIIQPYQFGNPFSKRTLLWLKGLPPLVSTNILKEYTPYLQSGGKDAEISKVRGVARSKTFQGIADAMADQWGGFLVTKKSMRV